MPAWSSELVERTEEGYRLTRTLEEVCAVALAAGPDGVTLLAMRPAQQAGTG